MPDEHNGFDEYKIFILEQLKEINSAQKETQRVMTEYIIKSNERMSGIEKNVQCIEGRFTTVTAIVAGVISTITNGVIIVAQWIIGKS